MIARYLAGKGGPEASSLPASKMRSPLLSDFPYFTPKSVRLLFKDPCSRLATEVSKALLELANSVRNQRQCSPEILSDHLHQALQDLDIALKSQPRLFFGSNPTNMLAETKPEKHNLSSVKTDASALMSGCIETNIEQDGNHKLGILGGVAVSDV
ncbi:hypothetical protein R6Q57_023232 [Mikania cordata]